MAHNVTCSSIAIDTDFDQRYNCSGDRDYKKKKNYIVAGWGGGVESADRR